LCSGVPVRWAGEVHARTAPNGRVAGVSGGFEHFDKAFGPSYTLPWSPGAPGRPKTRSEGSAMEKMPPGDPYVENILANVPMDVARTLSAQQWDGFREALRSTTGCRQHACDLRFVVPLYFLRLYCILILGRDRRERVEHVLFERRKCVARAAGALFLAVMFVAVAVLALAGLYVLKSAAGVDILPGFHLSEWIPGLGS